MADSIAVILSSGDGTAMATALDLVEAAVMMEMDAHVYVTGDAVRRLQGEDGGLLRRLREVREEGALKVYACSRAMANHGLSREALPPEVDEPAGFAFFLGLASEAKVTVSF